MTSNFITVLYFGQILNCQADRRLRYDDTTDMIGWVLRGKLSPPSIINPNQSAFLTPGKLAVMENSSKLGL